MAISSRNRHPGHSSYDLTNPQSLNRYSYALNSPLVYTDPSGLLVQIGNCLYAELAADDIIKAGDDNGQIIGGGDGDVYALQLLFCASAGGGGGTQGAGFGGGGGAAPSNAPTVSHCLGVAAADKGVSIGLDILGIIPAGNEVSAGVGIVRAAMAARKVITSPAFAVGSGVYGAYGGVTAGPEEATDSLVGSASAGAGIGLALADVSLEGTRAIPLVGNAVSVLTLGWGGYQAYKKYQSCMAGH